MRRTALAAIVSATLLLAACGNDAEPASTPTPTPSDTATTPSMDAPPSAEDIAALDAVVVEGTLGEVPTVTFDAPLEVSANVARVDTPGTGETLTEGALFQVHYLVVDGGTGDPVGSTWENGSPQVFALGDPSLPAAMNNVLAQQKVGVRFLLATPGQAGAEATSENPTTLLVFEVVGILPSRASGTEVTPPTGLPTVTLDDDGAPSIDVGDAAEPTELVSQTLIEGDGATVEAGQVLTVQYSGWLWDGTMFDSSWQSGTPFTTTIGAGMVIPGWDQGLVGKTVGSQVLLVIPSELGYGESGSGSVPGGATLIFVVDILDAA